MKEPEAMEYVGPGHMQVVEIGQGPRVVLVHGGGTGGALAWQFQQPLAERWRLVMPSRPGYGKSLPGPREDFESEAGLIAELLGQGAHLVGHSYGGVVALLAAARRPEAVRSLVLIEPGATSVGRGHPAVDRMEAGLNEVVRNLSRYDEEGALRAIFAVLDPSVEIPHPLPPPLLAFARRLPTLRWPMEAVIPLAQLAATRFPKLLVSGGGQPAFEAVADVLAARARWRAFRAPGGRPRHPDRGCPVQCPPGGVPPAGRVHGVARAERRPGGSLRSIVADPIKEVPCLAMTRKTPDGGTPGARVNSEDHPGADRTRITCPSCRCRCGRRRRRSRPCRPR